MSIAGQSFGETASANIAGHLEDMAIRQPHRLAVAAPSGQDRAGRTRYTQLTFGQLDRLSNEVANGLIAAGIGPGCRTVLMVPPSLEFYALTFGLFRAGAVPILIDPGMGIRKLGRCLAEAGPTAFIGVTKAHIARRVLGWAAATIRHTVHIGPGWPRFGLSLDDLTRNQGTTPPAGLAEPSEPDLAAILFTSGSTGPPKGVEYTHAIFQAQVRNLRGLYGIEPGEVDVPTFPLFGLFGPALGMSAVLPEMDFTRPARVDPRKLVTAIETFGATNMFGSPALLDRFGRYVERDQPGLTLESLRRVVSAGAPVSPAILTRFIPALTGDAEVFTPYGATEALPISSIGSREILEETAAATSHGAGVCVGRPAPEATVRIISITDEPITSWDEAHTLGPGEVGEVVVSGPMVTRRYDQRPEATRASKIPANRSGTAWWHRMGDVGYLDETGRLWFCGRKAHRVQTGSGTMFTVPCEGIFNAIPGVRRAALVGVPPTELPQRPVLWVEPEPDPRPDPHELRHIILARAAERAQTRSIETVLFAKHFPVDIRHNAKIFRERLAEEANRRLGRSPTNREKGPGR